MNDIITLIGDYAYTQYKIASTTANVVDASEASWQLSNIGDNLNRYPFYVNNSNPNITIIGGRIYGELSQTLDWKESYVNSAAVLIKHTPGVTVQDWIITRPWDGIRIAGDASENFLIEDNWIMQSRDDAIENDFGNGGTIRNNLLDGVFSGISLGAASTPDSSANIVTIDNVLLRMENYLYKGNVTHGSPLKMIPESQSLRIFDTIFAIEDVNHNGFGRLQLAWDKTIEASGNYLLNLTDKPLPSNYPLPGEGWTVLHGQAARDHWDTARSEWIAEHMEVSIEGGENDDILSGTQGKEYLIGRDGDDQIFGNGDDDVIDGNSGNDFLYGGLGADILSGGAGIDTASYRYAIATVVASLIDASVNEGEAWGDTYYDIENIEGSIFDDVISGNNNDNQILGLNGNDLLEGHSGNDILNGGAGNDVVIGGAGDDVLVYQLTENLSNIDSYNGDAGFDKLVFHFATNEYTQFVKDELQDFMNYMNANVDINSSIGTVYSFTTFGLSVSDTEKMEVYVDGTLQNDFFNFIFADETSIKTFGTEGNDVIQGHNQNETINGMDGNDILYGNEGNDRVYGGKGNDEIHGGLGKDLLKGHEGDDIVYGGEGSDTIWGDVHVTDTHEGHDTLYGGAGNDRIYGFHGNDVIYGDEGNDLLRGHQGMDIIEGGMGNDRLEGGDGQDHLYGGAENDVLNGGAGSDVLRGDGGIDRLNGQDGDDILYGDEGWDYLTGGSGSDIFIFEDINDYANNQFNRIRDFNESEGDTINLSLLIEAYDPLTEALSDYIAIVDNGRHTYLRVNETGSGITSDYTSVVMLENHTGIATNAQDMVDNGYLVI